MSNNNIYARDLPQEGRKSEMIIRRGTITRKDDVDTEEGTSKDRKAELETDMLARLEEEEKKFSAD
jgi:hypothetical protein